MWKAVFSATMVFIITIYSEALLAAPGRFNMSGIGIMIGVAIMCGLIVYYNEKKK